jgi:hypothetical protein
MNTGTPENDGAGNTMRDLLGGDVPKVPRTPCPSNAPGHDIHWMWAWKVGCRYIREHLEECVPVRVGDVGDGWFDVIFNGWTRRAWNHDPARVADIAGTTLVLYVPKYDILGGYGQAAHGDRASSTLTVIRPAWGGGAPCPHGVPDQEVWARDYGHGRVLSRLQWIRESGDLGPA